jgi:lysophospholipase L1-like esterase
VASQPHATPQIQLQPRQAILFLGDHTSPDEPGYVRLLGDILARFHPNLNLNLISAGSKGQTAQGLRSRTLLDMLISSKPNWVVLNIGLSDALREPALKAMLEEYGKRQEASDLAAEMTLGPEHRVRANDLGPVSDVGRPPEPQWERLEAFKSDLAQVCTELDQASVGRILITPVVAGDDLANPLNLALLAYSRAITQVARGQAAPLVDAHRAFRDVLDRAITYKQRVALASARGELKAQGQALLARTLLQAAGLLPYPGYRPPRAKGNQ